jgi:hypothetical protein
VDRINGVDIEILHPGDEWSTEIPLPLPYAIGDTLIDILSKVRPKNRSGKKGT